MSEAHAVSLRGRLHQLIYSSPVQGFIIVCIVVNAIQLGFDTWNALQLMQDCEKDGMPVVEIPQNARNLSPGMKEIESAIKSKRIHHDGNPILAWNMSNVVAHEDKNGNYKPNKPRPSTKIDGAVALIMAVSRAMLFNTMTAGEAISQGHGVRTL